MNNDNIVVLTKDQLEKLVISLIRGKNNERNAFQKTETILYHFHDFERIVEDKEEEIRELLTYGLRKTCSNIVGKPQGNGEAKELESVLVEKKISELNASISWTQTVVDNVTRELEKLKKDKYYALIEMKYFKGYTYEDIAEVFKVDVSTITRNRNRLVNHLAIRLFSDDVIRELYNL